MICLKGKEKKVCPKEKKCSRFLWQVLLKTVNNCCSNSPTLEQSKNKIKIRLHKVNQHLLMLKSDPELHVFIFCSIVMPRLSTNAPNCWSFIVQSTPRLYFKLFPNLNILENMDSPQISMVLTSLLQFLSKLAKWNPCQLIWSDRLSVRGLGVLP